MVLQVGINSCGIMQKSRSQLKPTAMIGTEMGPAIIMTKCETYKFYLPGLLCAGRHKIKTKPTQNSHKKKEKTPK
jgi:hypothetical protein